MKLLLDQGLARSTISSLGDVGIDARHVGELGLAKADDDVILEHGRKERRVVVTLDADFHMLLALSSAPSPSVIRVRIEGLKGAAMARLLQTVLDQCSGELAHGAAVSVQSDRIRIRLLPLG